MLLDGEQDKNEKSRPFLYLTISGLLPLEPKLWAHTVEQKVKLPLSMHASHER